MKNLKKGCGAAGGLSLFREDYPFGLLIKSMLVWVMSAIGPPVSAQHITVNLSMLEGLDITPNNLFNYDIHSGMTHSIPCEVEGEIRFRQTEHYIKYRYTVALNPGINHLGAKNIYPTWTFSSPALRELFEQYHVLPQGTYQYCVRMTTRAIGYEAGVQQVDDCVYHQSPDLFSITLVDPADESRINEFHPLLSWVATYPFPSSLTFGIRIAEIRKGQSTEAAIARNNPIYAEKNLHINSLSYPIYGRPLELWQPYAWTVDAYYKGILLGGAQPWQFTIVEDSLMETKPLETAYIDVNVDEGHNRYPAVGKIKLKYREQDFLENEIQLILIRKGEEKKDSERLWSISGGINFHTYDLQDSKLRAGEEFELALIFKNHRRRAVKQVIKFKYINPDHVK